MTSLPLLSISQWQLLIYCGIFFFIVSWPIHFLPQAGEPDYTHYKLVERQSCHFWGDSGLLNTDNPCPYRGIINLDKVSSKFRGRSWTRVELVCLRYFLLRLTSSRMLTLNESLNINDSSWTKCKGNSCNITMLKNQNHYLMRRRTEIIEQNWYFCLLPYS